MFHQVSGSYTHVLDRLRMLSSMKHYTSLFSCLSVCLSHAHLLAPPNTASHIATLLYLNRNKLQKVLLTFKFQIAKGNRAVPRQRQAVAGLSPQRSCFDPSPVIVGFMLDKVGLPKVSVQVLRFTHVSYHSTSASLPCNL